MHLPPRESEPEAASSNDRRTELTPYDGRNIDTTLSAIPPIVKMEDQIVRTIHPNSFSFVIRRNPHRGSSRKTQWLRTRQPTVGARRTGEEARGRSTGVRLR